MKSFQQFIIETELRDKEGLGGGTGMTHRGGEKIGSELKRLHQRRNELKQLGIKKLHLLKIINHAKI